MLQAKAILNRSVGILRHFRYGGMRAVKMHLTETNHNHIHVLSHRPPVVLTWLGRDDSTLHRALEDEQLVVHYIIPFAATDIAVTQIIGKVLPTLKRFRRHRVVILCNEEQTVWRFTKAGVEALYCNHNALVNEQVFRFLPDSQKTHDAIYNAALAPYKRWELAEQLNSLLAIAYAVSWMKVDDYAADIHRRLSKATWVVDAQKDCEKLSPYSLPAIYNRAEVGLCLS
jgi:hypothetical protein